MGESGTNKVLQRKARSAREEHAARVMSPARALRLALARAADDLFDLALTVSGVQVALVAQDPLLAMFDDERLLMVLDGPDGALGAAWVDMQVLGGLIEMQTMARVQPHAAAPRPPTQTDAAMFAPLLDAMLAGFAENLADAGGNDWAEGYRFGARIESARMLGLVLDAADFHVFRMEVDLSGAKRGEILLALPVKVRAEMEAVAGQSGAGDDDAEMTPVVLRQGALMRATVRLDAVLHRLQLPLAELAQLKPGDTLTLPHDALRNTRLEAGKARPLRRCQLGQINGFRAVRLLPRPNQVPAERDGDDGDMAAGKEERRLGRPGAAGAVGETIDAAIAPPRPAGTKARAAELASTYPDDDVLDAPTGHLSDGHAPRPGDDDRLGDLRDFSDLSDLPELALGDLVSGV